MPESPKPLDELQRRIDEAKSHAGMGAQASGDAAPRAAMGKGLQAGVEMVAGVAVGSGFGYFVDRWLETSPWFFIICFFLGAIAGFRNLIRQSRNTDDDSNLTV